MTGALLQILDETAQARMRPAPLSQRRLLIKDGSEERMREADAIAAGELDHAGGLRLGQRRAGLPVKASQQRARRARERGTGQQHRPRAPRQPGKARLDELAHAAGDWQWIARGGFGASGHQLPADLQRVEGVAARELVQTQEDRP